MKQLLLPPLALRCTRLCVPSLPLPWYRLPPWPWQSLVTGPPTSPRSPNSLHFRLTWHFQTKTWSCCSTLSAHNLPMASLAPRLRIKLFSYGHSSISTLLHTHHTFPPQALWICCSFCLECSLCLLWLSAKNVIKSNSSTLGSYSSFVGISSL
jgi:hypothetical protein